MNLKSPLSCFIKNKLEIQKIKRELKQSQNMLKNNTGSDASLIFNSVSLSWMFVAVTLFLQLISMATTYSGSKVYFGGIELPFSLSAPLLFAVSIQLTVFALSNSLKKNFKAIIIVILLTATLCSTYFSYIGIYNHINSPIIYLEERYNQIYHNLSKKYKITVDNSKTQMKEYVFDITSKLQKEYIRLSKENDNYNKLSEQISKVEMDSKIVTANTGSVVRPNINNYGSNLEKYYEDMAKYNAATASIVRQAAEQNSSLQSTLYENKIKTILQGKPLEQFAKEQAEIQSNVELLSNGILSMYSQIGKENIEFDKRISSIQQYCINYIISGEGEEDKFNSLLTNMYTVYSDITDTEVPQEFYLALNSFFTINDNDKTFMKTLSSAKEAVYYENYGKKPLEEVSLKLNDTMLLFSKLQSEIKNGIYVMNSLSGDRAAIDINSEDYVLENMYILPIKILFTKNTELHIAWFCFVFAALIDGLTLLFAMSHRENPKTLLAKRNSQLVKNNEELTEELLLSSLILHPGNDDNKSSAQLSLEHLAKFLTSFKITNIGMTKGYSLYCPLSKLKEYHIFLSVLCQFNLARIISDEELQLLKVTPTLEELNVAIQEGDSLHILDETAAAAYDTEDDSYVLLKTKFVIWVNQKFTIAAAKEGMSDAMIRILKSGSQKN